MRRIIIYSILFLSGNLLAQQKIDVQYLGADAKPLAEQVRLKNQFADSLQLEQFLQKTMYKLYAKGYIEASVDSVVQKDSAQKEVYFYLGKAYAIDYLRNGNLPEEALRKIPFKEEKFIDQKYSLGKIQSVLQKVLAFYQNRGYPFAEVYLDSFATANYQLQAYVFVQPHQPFTIDTLIVEGNTKTTSRFLQNYLNIRQGDLYHQAKIEAIERKLNNLAFVKTSQKPKLVFLNGKIKLYVYIEKQKANQFDALIGIAPNSSLTQNKVNITGNGKLRLLNPFGVGEEIAVDFKQLRPRTQNLDIKLSYPFLLNLPFGINGAFHLHKNDTLFLDLQSKAGVNYWFNGADYVQLFYENKTSNVLNFDTAKINRTKELPSVLDVRHHKIGLGLHLQNIDYAYNPRKGFHFNIDFAVGLRNIIENSKLKQLQANIYKNTALRSLNVQSQWQFKYHIPIKQRHSIHLYNKTAFLWAKNILDNEKFRIGGAQTLRGFDEESIYTPYFSLFTAEYHFLLSKNAYFYAFGDVAVVEDIRFPSKKIDVPFGFGVGASLETKGGILSLAYALGKQLDNKIDFRNGKIHFGYINLF